MDEYLFFAQKIALFKKKHIPLQSVCEIKVFAIERVCKIQRISPLLST